jgi:rare lipoprotein A (peptidoglycan hydrolase)
MTKHRKRGLLFMVCALALASSVPIAQAASGGTVAPPTGGGGADTSPPAASANSWTVFKKATWYGPGFWGNQTACGMKLQPSTVGTAHKSLPCGTQVTFTHQGRSVVATVIDRGPYRKGYAWDLTKKAAKRVGFLEVGSGKIRATVTPAG